jgi:WASH complex subunit strumpellin
MKDFHKYLSDLEEGVFIQHTFEGVLFNPDGKQLMAEAVYLFGVMLLLLDQRIDGLIRERMLVSYIRYKGESDIANIDQVCKLCRRTGWSTAPGAKRPANYPEDYFGRFPFPDEVPEMIIGRLRSDDIYQQISAYPNPAHRSTALATQAGMLYVILYFTPDILNNEAAIMREIVDKHFNDNWVVSFFMGHTVDLSLQWVPYQAAKTALMNTLVASNVKSVQEKHVKKIEPLLEKIAHYLEEGVLTDEAVLDTSAKLLQTQREANVTIRWLMLHLTTKHKKLLEAVVVDVNLDRVLLLLLNVAQFEYILKGMFQRLLDTKQARWDEFKKQACERVTELSEYFSGEKALTRVAKDEQLMAWFKDIADKISSLDYHDSTLAGRKIQQLSLALEEVESFHQIETNVHVKHFLGETRGFLMQMVRTVNCKEEILMVITLVSDISYARDIISDYIPMMQERIKRDPSSTLKLRSTFLKLATCLELPCVRIDQAKSPDLVSVMEYYSSSLVSFVRSVLQVVPSTMFTILNEIIDLTINSLKELPTRLPRAELRELAQLEERHTLARATHQIAVFTEGILAMETTFVGIIKVDPEQLLEDGIRRELVRQIANAMHQSLVFKHTRPGEFEGRLGELAHRLEGFRRSFEYCQDYLGLYALRVWQEEFSRIVNYNVEQECNSFLKKKVYDWASTYQSDSIPIPRLPPLDTDSVNFMGRLTREILLQTDSRRATYVDQLASWIDPAGNEIVGLRTFGAIHKSVGTFGLTGIDKLLCFMIVRDLREFTKLYRKHIDGQLNQFLVDYANEVAPLSTIPYNMARAIPRALNATSKLWPAFILGNFDFFFFLLFFMCCDRGWG